MALMSGLTQPKGSIRAVLAQYPMTNYLRRPQVSTDMDQVVAPSSIIDKHIASIKPDTVFSSAIPPDRMLLSFAFSVNERYLEFFGNDKKMWPVNLIEHKDYLPPTWIVHGDADTAVSIEDSRAFTEKCKELKGVEVRLVVRPHEEHGFDIGLKEDETEWLREGLNWIQGIWLG